MRESLIITVVWFLAKPLDSPFMNHSLPSVKGHLAGSLRMDSCTDVEECCNACRASSRVAFSRDTLFTFEGGKKKEEEGRERGEGKRGRRSHADSCKRSFFSHPSSPSRNTIQVAFSS